MPLPMTTACCCCCCPARVACDAGDAAAAAWVLWLLDVAERRTKRWLQRTCFILQVRTMLFAACAWCTLLPQLKACMLSTLKAVCTFALIEAASASKSTEMSTANLTTVCTVCTHRAGHGDQCGTSCWNSQTCLLDSFIFVPRVHLSGQDLPRHLGDISGVASWQML
jgi:hypothetical protein